MKVFQVLLDRKQTEIMNLGDVGMSDYNAYRIEISVGEDGELLDLSSYADIRLNYSINSIDTGTYSLTDDCLKVEDGIIVFDVPQKLMERQGYVVMQLQLLTDIGRITVLNKLMFIVKEVLESRFDSAEEEVIPVVDELYKLIHNKVDKEYKTGSNTEYKVLSDNNLTDAMVLKIRNAGSGTFTGSFEDLTDVPSDFPPSVHGHSIDDVNGLNDRFGGVDVKIEDAKALAQEAITKADTVINTLPNPIPIDRGGTGANTVSEARANLGLTNHRTYYWEETDTSLSYKDILERNWTSIDDECTFMAYIKRGNDTAIFEGYKTNDLNGSCLLHGANQNMQQIYVQNGVFNNVVTIDEMLTNADTSKISSVDILHCNKVGNMVDFAVTVQFTTAQKQIYVLNVSNDIFKSNQVGVARGVISSGVYTPGIWLMANGKIYLMLNEACTMATVYGQYFLY